MLPLHLNPKTTALVLIDLQKGILGMPTAPRSATEVAQRGRELASAFRAKGATVVYVRVDLADMLVLPVDAPPRDPSAPPPPASASELAPEAGFEEGDVLVTKRHWGAFAGTDLERTLRSRGVDTVVLAGVASSIGVESTARQGTGLGFAFVVVEDACTDRDADSHRAAFDRIFPRLARVRTTEAVIAGLA